MKRVLWFGFYDPNYSRNRVLLSGLRSLGIEVVECRVDQKSVGGLHKYLVLARQAWRLRHEPWDVVFVAFPGVTVVWLARLIFRAPIVFDAFLSVYQSEVEDRRHCSARSLRALILYISEWLAIRLANLTLLDTQQHIDYFVRTFRANPGRFVYAPIGADDAIFRPGVPGPVGPVFRVEFHGTFIPLQGIETILRAAKILEGESVEFRLIGHGQTFKAMKSLTEELNLKNVQLLGPLPQVTGSGSSVLSELQFADVVLGIFGTGHKTMMVVPNKVYEGLAVGKPVITADTPAIRGLLACGTEVFCVPPGDPAALASAILKLRGDQAEARRLAENGYRKYEQSFTPKAIVAQLLPDLDAVLGQLTLRPGKG